MANYLKRAFASVVGGLFGGTQPRSGPSDEDIIAAGPDGTSSCTLQDGDVSAAVEKLRQQGYQICEERVRQVLKNKYCIERNCCPDIAEIPAAQHSNHDLEILNPSRKKKRVGNYSLRKDLKGSLELISKLLKNGPNESQLEGKRHLVVLGVTGSGKSTLINSLAGCKMRQLTSAEADDREITHGSLCVVGMDERGPCDAVTEIGYAYGKSQTSECIAVDLANSGLVIWDVPGFEDTHGSEINIANAVSLSKLLKSSQQHGLVIMATLDAPSLESGRGQLVKKTFDILFQLFQSKDSKEEALSLLQDNLDGILFCVTKVKKGAFSLRTLKSWIQSTAKQASIDLDNTSESIFLYDPLESNPEALSRSKLIERALSLKTISCSAKGLFSPCLNEADLRLLSDIREQTLSEIRLAMKIDDGCERKEYDNLPDFETVKDRFDVFRDLSKISQDLLDAELDLIKSAIADIFKAWENEVLKRCAAFDRQGRLSTKFYLQCIQKGSILSYVFEDQSTLENMAVNLQVKVLEDEGKDQAEKRDKFRSRFDPSNLKAAIIKYFRMKEAEMELIPDLVDFIAFASLRDSIPEVNAVMGIFDEVQGYAAHISDTYVCGDQLDFKDLLSSLRTSAVDCSNEGILQVNVSIVVAKFTGNAKSVIDRYQWPPYNFPSKLLSDQPLAEEDFECLSDYGFAEGMRIDLTAVIDKIRELSSEELRVSLSGVLNTAFEQAHQLARGHVKELKENKRELIRSSIGSILARGEFQKDMLELKDALHNLGTLEGRDDVRYVSEINNVKSRLSSLHTVGEIQTLIQARSYHELISRFQTLRDLADVLKPYLDVDTHVIQEAVTREITILITSALAEIEMDSDNRRYLEFDQLRTFVSVFSTLKSAFPHITSNYSELQRKAKKTLLDMIDRARCIAQTLRSDEHKKEDQDSIARLLVKSCGVATELELLKEFKAQIRSRLLRSLTDHDRFMIGTALCSMSTNSDIPDSAQEITQVILATYPEFKTFNVELFNRKAGGVSFSDAVRDIVCHPEACKDGQRARLFAVYEVYSHIYSDKINIIVNNVSEFPADSNKQRIEDLAAVLSPHATNLGAKAEEFGEFLALICAHWTYLDTRSSIREGLDHKNVRQPHNTQILSILRLLGIDQSELRNHLIQINTGEGKSIALGFCAVCMAKLGLHVDVVCYSRYLSERDHKAFSDLFNELEAADSIRYNDFDQLSSMLIKEGTSLPNVRDIFLSFLEKKVERNTRHASKTSRMDLRQRKGSAGSVKVKTEPGLQPKSNPVKEELGDENGSAGCSAPVSKKRKSEYDSSDDHKRRILLLDEVDVFFSENFYSRSHRPAQEIGGVIGFSILKYVWEKRRSIENSDAFIHELLQLSDTKKLFRMYPGLSNELLTQEFRKMIVCVRRFAGQGLPRLTGGEKDYIVDVKEQRIAYNDPISGVPSYSTSYSYITAFTYLYCCEEKKLDEARISDRIRIQPICGSLSYSEILKFYDFTLGMTGTLDCLTEAQNRLLEEFNLMQSSILPTTFNKKQLNSELLMRNPERVQTIVVRGSYDEYFVKILEDITDELQVGRAILIVFEDHARLQRFSNEIKLRSPKLPQYKPPLILDDFLSDAERQSVVARAVRRYAITLVTRTYGRGTDFVCCDEGLRKNGGVHIILTFFPEDESEAKQINGRTCRQDDPGSAKMILFEDDVSYLGASEQNFMNSGCSSWDQYLSNLRNAVLQKKYEAMHAQHEELMVKHHKTLKACEATNAKDWSAAEELFLELNQEVQQKTLSSTASVDICFVMDCTGSMSAWIKACKDRVMLIASQIKAVIGDQGHEAKVRMAFVAYRDYLPPTGRALEYDRPGIQHIEFTEDIEAFRGFLTGLEATGGNDVPEDLCGGLRQAQSLSWAADARHLFLIADAPCHGSKYHSCQDYFPQGDPTGLVPEEQLTDLMRDDQTPGIRVTFININPSTGPMLRIFNDHCGAAVGRQVKVADLSHCGVDSQGITAEFGRVVEEEIITDWIAHHC